MINIISIYKNSRRYCKKEFKRCALLIVGLLAIFASSSFANVDEMSINAIRDRIKPVGEVYLAQPQKQTPESSASQKTTSGQPIKTGEQVYKDHCKICHEAGVLGAPKIGDAQAWQPRVAQGLDQLVEHADKGYKLMPPKGTCTDCSKEEIKNAILYLLQQSKVNI